MSFIFHERKRIAKRSRIGDVVFGTQDGVITTIGVLSSMYGAAQSNGVILIAGFSAVVAGMFSMATGSYLAAQAEADVERAEMEDEANKIRNQPRAELRELIQIYERQGMGHEQAVEAAETVMEDPERALEVMAHVELGVDPQPRQTSIRDALSMAFSFIAGGAVPILPYFVLHGIGAFGLSVALAVLGLFALGIVKGKIAATSLWRSGLETCLIGSGAAALGFVVGTVIPKIFGLRF